MGKHVFFENRIVFQAAKNMAQPGGCQADKIRQNLYKFGAVHGGLFRRKKF
jgi:hypothetical protein